MVPCGSCNSTLSRCCVLYLFTGPLFFSFAFSHYSWHVGHSIVLLGRILYVLASILAKIFIRWPISCQGYFFAYRRFAVDLESGSFDWRVVLTHSDLCICHIDHIRFLIHPEYFPCTHTTVTKCPLWLFQICTTCLSNLIIVLLSIVELVIAIQYSATLLWVFPRLQSWHARCLV